MDSKAAKELMHIDSWLDRVARIVALGEAAYLAMIFFRRRATR